MQGLMMDYPLTLTHILERAQKLYSKKEIATKTPAGMHRPIMVAEIIGVLAPMHRGCLSAAEPAGILEFGVIDHDLVGGGACGASDHQR